jgi:putative phosphoesterase
MSHMRIALISDIHGNLTPLEAVTSDIRDRGVEMTVCLGDTATLGTHPGQVLDVLKDMKCACIMGNHDLAILYPHEAAEFRYPNQFRASLEWNLRHISKEQINFMRSFNTTLSLRLQDDMELLCYHGSPRTSYELVLSTSPEVELSAIFSGCNAELLAGGHTHQPMLRKFGSRLVINPGSVGSAWVWDGLPPGPTLMPWAEYAILDVEENRITIETRRLSFDTGRARKIISSTDSPDKECWLNGY